METEIQVTDRQFNSCETGITPDAEPTPQRDEENLAAGIVGSWRKFRNLQRSVKKSRKELQSLGQTLGEALFGMKALLSKPGCKGNWSAFLRENRIPRTSGDRLVRAYERSLNPGVNCANGAIQTLTRDAVHKLCTAVWSRSNKKFSTYESKFWFCCELALVSGARHEVRKGGVFVFDSPYETASESSNAAAALMTSDGLAAVASQVSDKVQ